MATITRKQTPGFISATVEFKGSDLPPVPVVVTIPNTKIQMQTAMDLIAKEALNLLQAELLLSDIIIGEGTPPELEFTGDVSAVGLVATASPLPLGLAQADEDEDDLTDEDFGILDRSSDPTSSTYNEHGV